MSSRSRTIGHHDVMHVASATLNHSFAGPDSVPSGGQLAASTLTVRNRDTNAAIVTQMHPDAGHVQSMGQSSGGLPVTVAVWNRICSKPRH